MEKPGAEAVVREIKRRTRKKYSSEEKIRIVLEGLRGEMSIAELCRKEGIHEAMYYKWSKDFLEAGKKRLQGDTASAVIRATPGLPYNGNPARNLCVPKNILSSQFGKR